MEISIKKQIIKQKKFYKLKIKNKRYENINLKV